MELTEVLFNRLSTAELRAIDIQPENNPILMRDISTEYRMYPFAKDATGGFYFQIDGSQIGYCSTEGQIGAIAQNEDDFVSLLLMKPYWMDILKFSNGGDLDEMTKADKSLASVYRSTLAQLASVKNKIGEALKLSFNSDVLEKLHSSSVNSRIHMQTFQDGYPYASLIGTYRASGLED